MCILKRLKRMFCLFLACCIIFSTVVLAFMSSTIEVQAKTDANSMVQMFLAYAEADESRFSQWADLIYEQALLADQGALKDPSTFVKAMNTLLLG